MQFEVLPVVETMLALYQLPRNQRRFQEYLRRLRGTTRDDLVLPLGYFNPMAKDAVAHQLLALREAGAEPTMRATLAALNQSPALPADPVTVLQVALNLADDAHGGWTNRSTTDYASRFQLRALVKRGFVVVVCWTSEVVDAALLSQRTREAAWRTVAWLRHGTPRTLHEHLVQEHFVHTHAGPLPPPPDAANSRVRAAYREHRDSTSTAVILAFLYGDAAATELGHPPLGVGTGAPGLTFARRPVAEW